MNYPPLAGPDFPRFAPLISDFGFKAAFGNEATGEFLCRALQALIKSEVPIRAARLLPTEQTRLTPDSRSGWRGAVPRAEVPPASSRQSLNGS